jgi:anti-sigma factor RsiW
MTRSRASRGEDHRHAQALLPWYVTGQLDPAEARRVEAHLGVCGACRTELTAERRLREAIASTPLEAWSHASRPRRMGVAASVAALAIAASFAVTVVALSPVRAPVRESIFRTLGAAPASSGAELVVVFDPACPERQMRSALTQAHARIVDGPTRAGAYVLRASPGGRDGALAVLRGSPGVRLAQSLGGAG